MKRGWVSERDQDPSGFGEGSDTAQRKAMVLAEIADADLIDSFIKVTTALQAFGGRAFIAAKRLRLDRNGNVVSHNEVGQYTTLAYLVHYDHENVKGEPEEPEVQFKDVERTFEEGLGTGERAPEPAEDGAEPERAEVTA